MEKGGLEYVIRGGQKLAGSVEIQGAKNAAMRHMVLPLLSPGKFEFRNVPNISSCHNLAGITESMGARVEWDAVGHIMRFDSSKVAPRVITEDQFFHTSGAVYAVQVLVNRWGECEVENKSGRKDSGGDQLGRKLDTGLWEQLGVNIEFMSDKIRFTSSGKKAFVIDAKRFFGPSSAGVLAALFREGVSEIVNPTEAAEFDDLVMAVRAMGAEITVTDGKISVRGGLELRPITWKVLPDRHDLVTWISAALATGSELEISNVDYEAMKLKGLTDLMKVMRAKIEFDEGKCRVKKSNLRPVKQVFYDFPLPATEWQVLLSAVFTRIRGISEIVEGYFPDRMRHWNELGRMGAKFEYFSHPGYPESGDKPRAARIYGPTELRGALVEGRDVRSVAALIVAGLIAGGETRVVDKEDNLGRGYDDFVGRLKNIGGHIEVVKTK